MSESQNPPKITSGSFVSWSGGKGRVDLIVTTGTVPGVTGEPVEATSDSPAARVVVWKDGKATREKVAASTHTLKRIAPLDADEAKGDPAARLVALQGAHERQVRSAGTPASGLTGVAFKTAYDRGLRDWPGSDVTSVSPVEWALGRASHLAKAALGTASVTNDADLLHKSHPLAAGRKRVQTEPAKPRQAALVPAGDEALIPGVTEEMPAQEVLDLTGGDEPVDGVTITAAEVDATVAALLEAGDEEPAHD